MFLIQIYQQTDINIRIHKEYNLADILSPMTAVKKVNYSYVVQLQYSIKRHYKKKRVASSSYFT